MKYFIAYETTDIIITTCSALNGGDSSKGTVRTEGL